MGVTKRDTVTSDDGKGTTVTSERIDAPQDSVEVSLNAKGEPSWSVKAYGATPEEVEERLIKLRHIAEQAALAAKQAKGASQ